MTGRRERVGGSIGDRKRWRGGKEEGVGVGGIENEGTEVIRISEKQKHGF